MNYTLLYFYSLQFRERPQALKSILFLLYLYPGSSLKFNSFERVYRIWKRIETTIMVLEQYFKFLFKIEHTALEMFQIIWNIYQKNFEVFLSICLHLLYICLMLAYTSLFLHDHLKLNKISFASLVQTYISRCLLYS